MRKNIQTAKGFSLVEIMIAVSIGAILLIASLQYFLPNQQKARDQVRITRMAQMETAIEKFRNEYYAYPIASSMGSASDFSEVSGVPQDEAEFFVNQSAVCSNRASTNPGKTAQTSKMWHWFGKYLTKGASGSDPKQDNDGFKVAMNDTLGPVEGVDLRDGFVYKGVVQNGEFMYEFATPLELGNADARMDGGKLGDRFFEKGNLVGTDHAISDADLSCMKVDGKLPFDIKVKTN